MIDRSREPRGRDLIDFVELVVRRFFAQGMTVYAAALAYRGLLALVPFALFFLSLIGLFGIEGAIPRITEALRTLRGVSAEQTAAVPLEGLFSIGAAVGIWSMSMGARVFIRAANVAHSVDETRSPVARAASSVIFLPALALTVVLATVLLVMTSRLLVWGGGLFGAEGWVTFLQGWLRMPLSLAVIAGAVAAAYRYAPATRPPPRAVAAGATVAVVLWAAASFGFAFAIDTVVDYGSTYGALGAAVALLVYLHISANVLLLGAQVSGVISSNTRSAVPNPIALTAWGEQ